ncbi:MAG TPA: glycosyltransferase [Geobacteraceae bacterium]|nr:glycosyltransferase [Geobacteraceae bacterium]
MSEPITVLHLRASNFIGGPERQIIEHFRRVDRARFRPILCSFAENDGEDPYLEQVRRFDIEYRTISSRSGSDLRAIGELRQIIRRDNVRILCTHGYKPNVIGRLASWICGIPTVAISRGWTSESRKIRMYERLDKLFLHLADHVVAVSEGQKRKIAALGVAGHRVTVIHNAIDLAAVPTAAAESIHALWGIPDASLVVASAGRLSPEKNYAGLIDAARVVIAQRPATRFIVFGEGALRRVLESRIAACGLGGKFLLPGFRKDIHQLMTEVDIFVLPSFSEGLPNVILEAAAAKKPVVATAVGGTPEVVVDGETGFLVAPTDTERLASCILRLVDDPQLRESMGTAGYAYVNDNFTYEKQTKQYQELYETILNRRHARS